MYFDYNATTPLDPEVIRAIRRMCEEAWINPSSGYKRGREVKKIIEDARQKVAKMVGIQEGNPFDVITFTSGGTEANFTVMHWAIEAFKKQFLGKIPHIVTSNIEHCATELPLKRWQEKGEIEVSFVKVQNGKVLVEDVEKAIKSNTCLVTVMLANNETGVIQPLKEIGDLIQKLNQDRAFKILLHSDAAQAFAKIPVDAKEMKVDYLTIVGHKVRLRDKQQTLDKSLFFQSF